MSDELDPGEPTEIGVVPIALGQIVMTHLRDEGFDVVGHDVFNIVSNVSSGFRILVPYEQSEAAAVRLDEILSELSMPNLAPLNVISIRDRCHVGQGMTMVSKSMSLSGSGYCGSICSRWCRRIRAMQTLRAHLRSAGTTYHGASSVDVFSSASVYASM